MTLLERVKALMKHNNINAKQLTAELGISSSSFSDWGRGKGSPSLDTVTKFAAYFDVSIDFLVHGEEHSSRTKNLEFSNPRTEALLSKFHSLTPELQDRLIIYADGMLAAIPESPKDEKRLSS